MINLKISRTTLIIFGVVALISLAGFFSAYIYYGSVNKAEDPRVLENKFRLTRYEVFLQQKMYDQALLVLDSIEETFLITPGYSQSYENGIVNNNRASVFITKALYENHDSVQKSAFLDTALNYSTRSIDMYNQWINLIGEDSESLILKKIYPYFCKTDSSFRDKNFEKIVKKRLKDILLAKKEMPRRLSVAYTNLGIIRRHLYKQNEAMESYIKALTLWSENPSALSNLNVLMGNPPKDRSVLRKMFPPDKNKFN